MLKKVNKVLVSVVIIASLVFFLFADGTKLTVPLGYFNFGKNVKQTQVHSPPTNKGKGNFSPPTVEQTIKKEKQPVEKSVKDIHSEVSIKGNTMKFKINPEYKLKIGEGKFIPSLGGKFKPLRLLIP